jgi:hypothetical protein
VAAQRAANPIGNLIDAVRDALDPRLGMPKWKSRAQFEANMDAKMRDDVFLTDLTPLLRPAVKFDNHEAWQQVHEQIVSRLLGEPWKGREL